MQPEGDRLYARAVDFGPVTMVALDQLTVPESFYRRVVSLVGDDRVLLVATHTHCAPDSQMLNDRMTFAVPGIASYSERWTEWYASQVASAVKACRRATGLSAATFDLVRTQVDLNRGRRPQVKPDKTLWCLTAQGTPLVAGYAAHATFYEEGHNKTAGDWPGRLSQALGCPVVPGAIGDVSPKAPGNGPVEKCAQFVDKFVCGLSQSRPIRVWWSGQQVAFDREAVELDQPVPHPEFAKAFGAPDALAQVLVQRFAEQTCQVTGLVIGKFLLLGVPGEPSAALGRRLQAAARRAGFPHCLVVSHANGWVGYILEADDYGRGGYEARLMFNGSGTADRIVRGAETLMVRLKGQTPGHGSATTGNSGRTRSF